MTAVKLKQLIFDPVFFKFILVGLLNTAIGSAVMFGLYNLAGLGYWASSVLSCGATSILSFFLNKYFTFGVKEWSLRMILVFALVIAVSYITAYSVAKPFIHRLLRNYDERLRDNAAMLTGMGLFTAINYLGQRFAAFKRKKYEGS
ncbi:MAG: GtrA family protein [Treponema sp.]|jgi:putative flippase GtrA|nr:GtrA family protein [Treponema sp.]